MGEVVDLDILRPEPVIVKLKGFEIDVSYIPCAITFKADDLMKKMNGFDAEEVQKGGEATEEAFDATIELCSLFCSWKHPEMTKKWFFENTDPIQINKLAETIQNTLLRSYNGAEEYSKN